MPGLTELDGFMNLSKVLTGEPKLDRTLANEYLQRLKGQNPAEIQKILDEFGKIADDPYLVFEVKRRIVETKEPGNEALPSMAQQIIRIWYTSEFFPLGPDGKPGSVADGGTQKQYYRGLLWKVLQAHAPTHSTQKYGYWTTKP
jgi:Membrane bound FAD containing D-sorbitol dehydrogenase